MATASQQQGTEATDAAALEVDVSWLFAEPPAQARGSPLQTSSGGRALASAAAASLIRQPLGSAARQPVVCAPSRSVEAGPGPSIRGPGPSTRRHRGAGRFTTASAHTPRRRHRLYDDGLDMMPDDKLMDDPLEQLESKLIRAARKGAVEEVQAELAAGADMDEEDCTFGYTALHLAAQYGHAEVVRCLLESGAKMRATGALQHTPLHAAMMNFDKAIEERRTAVVRLLLAASADPNTRDMMGYTPLHWAAGNGNTEVVAALLDAGADKRARDHEGRTALDSARQGKHRQLVQMLM